MIHEKRHWETMRDIGDIKGDIGRHWETLGDIGRHWETLGDNGRQKGDTAGEITRDIQRHNWRHWKMTGDKLL
jgi:hypothetical protein